MGREHALKGGDKEKVIALLESGYTQVKVAQMFEVSRRTVQTAWLDHKALVAKEDSGEISVGESEELAVNRESIQHLKGKFAQKCVNVMDSLVEGITPDKISKTGVRDLAVSFGVFADKLAIYKGLATQNVDIRHTLVNKIRKSQKAE